MIYCIVCTFISHQSQWDWQWSRQQPSYCFILLCLICYFLFLFWCTGWCYFYGITISLSSHFIFIIARLSFITSMIFFYYFFVAYWVPQLLQEVQSYTKFGCQCAFKTHKTSMLLIASLCHCLKRVNIKITTLLPSNIIVEKHLWKRYCLFLVKCRCKFPKTSKGKWMTTKSNMKQQRERKEMNSIG